MQNMLKILLPAQQEELTHAIQKIAAETGAERIYCYGFRTTQRTEWSLFHAGAGTDKQVNVYYYDLLLVIPGVDANCQDKIDGIAHRPICSHASFYYRGHTSFGFSNLLKIGNPFISKVHREGVILYNSSPYSLPKNGLPSLSLVCANTANLHWVRTINRARAIYRMAERASAKNKRREALGHLEETACQACMALITLYTGHSQGNQVLRQLLQYCDNFCGIRTRIFPCNTPEEAELLQWLETAVLTEDTGHEYHVPGYILDTLVRRINKLLELADWLYTQKTGNRAAARINTNSITV
jgi:hypothetical protein